MQETACGEIGLLRADGEEAKDPQTCQANACLLLLSGFQLYSKLS